MVLYKRSKLIQGVGVNDADYNIVIFKIIDGKRKRVWVCPFYQSWTNMIERCYSNKSHVKNPTYRGCTVCPEWHYFMTFRAWMVTQDWEDKQLDKDLLLKDNKVYSPETCIFVSRQINLFMTEKRSDRGQLPTGVSMDNYKNKYKAVCSDLGRGQKYLGIFNTIEEAHNNYLIYKRKLAIELASLQTDTRISDALIARYS